ncbi:A/G-specific adenine glycosylase [Pelagibacteraceae bacterium]|nr:A/G-specific adenine glycosylase [Pelagibacteraceae bacterium]|tara:strand:+ start:790 stop:1665 length:876 start_codon:yes stop_codon:yes gene_type:complete
MLQQTQVKTVIPYFNKFTKKFKTLQNLSKSKEKEILKLWEGLGYYRRARNLLASSKLLVKEYNSKLPYEIKEIKKLPGVGEYTANALLGLVHNKPTIAIDGNVKRVFARVLNKKELKIDFEKFIELNKKNLFSTKRNSDFVEALMEFGALICKPKDPKCSICNLKKMCKYFNTSNKIKNIKKKMIKNKNYDVFCYMNKKKEMALTKKNKLGFLSEFNLPQIKETNLKVRKASWKFLSNYKNSISNIKLNINLYYKFSNKIPSNYSWFSIEKNKEFIPTFTKKIFKQVSVLF